MISTMLGCSFAARVLDSNPTITQAKRLAIVIPERVVRFHIDLDSLMSSLTVGDRRLADARGHFEEELRNQLRRSAAAHSSHLEQVLAVQKQQLEEDARRQVDEAVSAERAEFHAMMSSSLQRLQTIETALESRQAQVSQSLRYDST